MAVSRLCATAGLLAAALLGLATGAVGAAQPPDGRDPGHPETRIVGGEPASIQEYPWTVYLQTAGGFQYCGGTLVAPSKVVTAAHCTVDITAANVFVVAGREDSRTEEGTVSRVTGIWLHPEYDRTVYRNDVSVLTLDRRLPFPTLPLATPAHSGFYTEGTPATILGWGMTEQGSPSPNLLRASVPVGADSFCIGGYGVQYDPTTMVCAGYPEGGVDTCQGDSGGPLVVGGRLIGITSFGSGCGEPGYPGVYTRVARYSDLIAAQLQG